MDAKTRQKIENFFEQFQLREYNKGQILIYGGDDPTGIFCLLDGSVRVYDITSSGDQVVLNVYRPLSFFPMSWAVNRRPNSYFFEAATKVTVRMAPTDQTLLFMKKNPDVMYDLLSRLYLGTDGLLERIKYLMKGTARSQVILELSIETKRFGQKRSDGFLIDIPEAELAMRTGLTRETVSREMNRLQKEGLIKIHYKSVLVKNTQKLDEELQNSI